MLQQLLEELKRRLTDEPPSILPIASARTLMRLYPREELPDWVEILANGNPDMPADVIDVTLADIKAEEQSNDQQLPQF